MRNKHVLITGVAGLVGSRLAKHLLEEGFNVTGLDLNAEISKAPFSNRLNNFNYISANLLTDLEKIELNSRFGDICSVVHCAAQQPRKNIELCHYINANVLALEKILGWSQCKKIPKFISLSTATSFRFSTVQSELINEESAIEPQNDYALSKFYGECLLRQRSLKSQTKIICLKLPSVIVEEQQGGLVHTYYEHAAKKLNLSLFSEGRYRRSLIYIDDVILGIKKALYGENDKRMYQDYILATSDAWTMEDIAKYIFKKLDSKSQIEKSKKEAPVRGHGVLSTIKACNELGFEPSSTQESIDQYLGKMNCHYTKEKL